mmetsp:Transcript_1572/g.2253  ORF Transcript_1572/g.2253 Transcript_1572/m.2253 type:complete len:213 (-) Transcript_1572:124-762(-)
MAVAEGGPFRYTVPATGKLVQGVLRVVGQYFIEVDPSIDGVRVGQISNSRCFFRSIFHRIFPSLCFLTSLVLVVIQPLGRLRLFRLSFFVVQILVIRLSCPLPFKTITKMRTLPLSLAVASQSATHELRIAALRLGIFFMDFESTGPCLCGQALERVLAVGALGKTGGFLKAKSTSCSRQINGQSTRSVFIYVLLYFRIRMIYVRCWYIIFR